VLLHALIPSSRANGPGLRALVFFQGRALACPGCWDPETHPLSRCGSHGIPHPWLALVEPHLAWLGLRYHLKESVRAGSCSVKRQPLKSFVMKVSSENLRVTL
jgi:pyruvate-formate lyase-activating enzyme